MFGNKKQENQNSPTNTPSTAGASNIITAGTTVEGDIRAVGDIRVDGSVTGNLICQGKLVIGPEGSVTGNIECQNAVIEGRFEGELICSELLNVRETANIDGIIRTDKLIVQSGAVYNVTCQMGNLTARRSGSKATAEA